MEGFSGYTPSMHNKDAEYPIDELDRKIIRLLQQNGRTPNTELARKLDLTETTVRKRIARLLDEDLISIVAVPTPRVPSTLVSALLGISVKLSAFDSVAAELAKAPEARYLSRTSGRYDFILEAFFASHEHLVQFISEHLGGIEGVEDVETSVVLRIEKFGYDWPIP